MARLNKKRLSVDMPVWMHEELRLMAKKGNTTITLYLLKIIESVIIQDKKYQ
jgi:hypothetical protein